MHTIQNSKDTKRSKSLIYTPNFHVLLSSQTDFPFWLLLDLILRHQIFKILEVPIADKSPLASRNSVGVQAPLILFLHDSLVLWDQNPKFFEILFFGVLVSAIF